MTADSLFDRLAAEVEDRTSLTRLQARGALRLAQKRAGLSSANLTKTAAIVVVERLLPEALARQGVEADAVNELCLALKATVESSEEEAQWGLGAMFERLDSVRGKKN